jgi:ribonuclease-3
MKSLKYLEKELNIFFNNKELLKNAFIHRSYLNENKKRTVVSNEKLEFLGDSVLSLISSQYLFINYPLYSEGEYTDIKASVVKTESLAATSAKLNLGEYLYLSKGEEKGGGRRNKNILADCFEAVLAAIFIDKGFNRAYKFAETYLFKEKLDDIIKNKKYLSSKSKLQEIFQRKYKQTPEYKTINESGPEHKRIFSVGIFFRNRKLAQGTGMSKKQAEDEAAKIALIKLRILKAK